MCSISEAFSNLRVCSIVVEGVGGSLHVRGVGTATFLTTTSTGKVILIRIHNCLLCDSEYNLLSVSQLQLGGRNSVDFQNSSPTIGTTSVRRRSSRKEFRREKIPLTISDGLYKMTVKLISLNDPQFEKLYQVELTEDGDYSPPSTTYEMMLKSPAHDVPVSGKVTYTVYACPVVPTFGAALIDFADQYLSPPAVPPTRKTFRVDNPTDLSELSIRMMGVGTDRVKNTIRISKGLSPSGEVPPFLFPQANMKSGKTPRVSKGVVHDLHTASIGEVVFTDTFETADDKYRYGQAFVCYRSRFGDVIPIRS